MKKIKVGKIVNTHGIKGELKVSFDDIELFEKGTLIYIEVKKEYLEFNLTDFRIHKNHLLIKLNDYNNINDVEKYKGNDVYIDREEDEVYYSDLIGYKIIDSDKKEYGKVENIINNNAHDIFVLSDNIMIPYVDEFIIDIDDSTHEITINVIEGLFDED